MSAHTQGPWHRNIPAEGRYPVVFAGRNQHIATAAQQKDSAETESNISLIAAAPELLAALRLMLREYEALRFEQPERWPAAAAAARAAIAKAGGAA